MWADDNEKDNVKEWKRKVTMDVCVMCDVCVCVCVCPSFARRAGKNRVKFFNFDLILYDTMHGSRGSMHLSLVWSSFNS